MEDVKLTKETADALAVIIAALRPKWATAAIVASLAKLKNIDDPDLIKAAQWALWAAANPQALTPAAIGYPDMRKPPPSEPVKNATRETACDFCGLVESRCEVQPGRDHRFAPRRSRRGEPPPVELLEDVRTKLSGVVERPTGVTSGSWDHPGASRPSGEELARSFAAAQAAAQHRLAEINQGMTQKQGAGW